MKLTWQKLWKAAYSPAMFIPKSLLFYGNDLEQIVRKTQKYAAYAYSNYKTKVLKNQDMLKLPHALFRLKGGDVDLFGKAEKYVVIITQPTDKLLDVLVSAIDFFKEVPVFLCGTRLSKKSLLREYFEKSKDLGIVASYEPDRSGFLSMAQCLNHKIGLVVEDEVLTTLGEQLEWNTEALELTLQKIKWLAECDHDKKITLRHIWLCTTLFQPDQDEFIDAFMRKDVDKAALKLESLQHENLIQVLLFLGHSFGKLAELHDIVRQGVSVDRAVYSLKPMLPPHINQRLIVGASRWSRSKTHTLLAKFLVLERKLKRRDITPLQAYQELFVEIM